MTMLLSMNNAITARSIIIMAGMDRELNRGSHTVLVPGNFAVRDIAGSQSQMNALTTDMRAANQVMQGLVTNGMVLPGEMARGRTITMLNGKTLSTSSKDGTLMLDGARITRAIQATNGMIYVIDSMPGQ
ncbi:fasciclin domain-containing protein [Methanocella sp. MCL-LM]|uniref:fasciclin domain-containing protein n=1 Tax=Methanocella sp. MCL-LM TaxID=3412035 RepID=UPI003C70DE28